MVRPRNHHRYKQYEDRFNPSIPIESMFQSVTKSTVKKDVIKASLPVIPSTSQNQKRRERSGWERKEDKTQYNEQALAINSKSKVEKSSTGANKSRNYLEQQNHHRPQPLLPQASSKRSEKTIQEDDEKDTDDSEEFFQLIRETVAESVKVSIYLDKAIL